MPYETHADDIKFYPNYVIEYVQVKWQSLLLATVYNMAY